jgi:hypothetical protein
MNQYATSQVLDVKQEEEENKIINIKVRVSFGSKGGWDRDVTLNVGATNLARLILGRRSILQDQMHNEAFQAAECVCEQGWKARLQHWVRGLSSIERIKFVIFIFSPFSPRCCTC